MYPLFPIKLWTCRHCGLGQLDQDVATTPPSSAGLSSSPPPALPPTGIPLPSMLFREALMRVRLGERLKRLSCGVLRHVGEIRSALSRTGGREAGASLGLVSPALEALLELVNDCGMLTNMDEGAKV